MFGFFNFCWSYKQAVLLMDFKDHIDWQFWLLQTFKERRYLCTLSYICQIMSGYSFLCSLRPKLICFETFDSLESKAFILQIIVYVIEWNSDVIEKHEMFAFDLLVVFYNLHVICVLCDMVLLLFYSYEKEFRIEHHLNDVNSNNCSLLSCLSGR